jgi:alpha-L-arabinofuranosidase
MNTESPQLRSLVKTVAVICALCLGTLGQLATAQTRITVQLDRPGAAIPPNLFGLFFEDINFAADGGLYPERVKNRSFEFPDPLMGWKQTDGKESKGTVYVLDRGSVKDVPNSHYVRIKTEAESKGFGLRNEGFRGIGVKTDGDYLFSLSVRLVSGGPIALRIELQDEAGATIGQTRIEGLTSSWQKRRSTIRASTTSLKAHLNVLVEGRGVVDLDVVSLYPKETWKNRENGLRADLVQLLRDMKPGFLRFPGGCIVEGSILERRYQWKTTIGDVDDRKLIVNRWNYEFKHRPAPDYYQSYGLGFYDYFLLSEDIGASPLPIINCGMACQFNTGELAPLEDLDHYIQDALDLIDFANAPVNTVWGKRRAQLGHPAPFNLKMLGVGNEQWGPQYIERYEIFARVLKQKHPEISLITSAGPSPDGERFDYLWSKLRELNADIVDEHYYSAPGWFPANAARYDNYPRTGPKVFAGEYAAQSVAIASPDNRNNWECALSEAAFMTGLERNADVVVMASYAPLFAHVDAWQWTPNLIWFDNLRSYATPNYYVQKLFSVHKGTTILPVLLDGAKQNGAGGLFATASWERKSGEVFLKVVNTSSVARDVRVDLAGARPGKQRGQEIVLASGDLKAENSLDQPEKVAPVERKLEFPANEFAYKFAPNSLTVLRLAGN